VVKVLVSCSLTLSTSSPFLLGKLKPERCPICKGSNFSEVAPAPEPIIVKETVKETVKEVVLIPCQYCGGLTPQTALFCPNCGARRK